MGGRRNDERKEEERKHMQCILCTLKQGDERVVRKPCTVFLSEGHGVLRTTHPSHAGEWGNAVC